jgi:hypothetical protein
MECERRAIEVIIYPNDFGDVKEMTAIKNIIISPHNKTRKKMLQIKTYGFKKDMNEMVLKYLATN